MSLRYLGAYTGWWLIRYRPVGFWVVGVIDIKICLGSKALIWYE